MENEIRQGARADRLIAGVDAVRGGTVPELNRWDQERLERVVNEDFTYEEVVELAAIILNNRLVHQGYADFLKLAAGWRRQHAKINELQAENARLRDNLAASVELTQIREEQLREELTCIDQARAWAKAWKASAVHWRRKCLDDTEILRQANENRLDELQFLRDERDEGRDNQQVQVVAASNGKPK